MEKLFKLKANGTTVRTEILAGLTTFMTMAYILAVNPALEGSPELVNSDPYGEGWMFRLQPANPAQINDMLDAEGYSCVIGA